MSTSFDPTSIAVGESTTVTATVENVGDQYGRTSVKLYVDGEDTGESRTVRLYPGDTDEVTFAKSFHEAGEYDLRVDDVAVGTLTVTEPTPTPDETETADGTTDGESTSTPDAGPGSPVVDGDGATAGDGTGSSPVRLIAGGQLWGLLVLLLLLASALGIAGYRQYVQ